MTSRPVALHAAVTAASDKPSLIIRHLVMASYGPPSDALRQVREAKRHWQELGDTIMLAELRLQDAANREEVA